MARARKAASVSRPLVLGIVLLLAVLTAAGVAAPQKEKTMKRLTPVLMVEEIEPCLNFWVERLGFEKTTEVPEGDKIGFVILNNGAAEIILQSRASVAKDVPALAQGDLSRSGIGLFVEVEKLDDLLPKLKGVEVVVPERTTFYGAREIGVRDPCGTTVVLAEFTKQEK